jgi:leucyl aminopeptidase
MTDALPFIDSPTASAIPIEPIRAADWPRWAESHAASLRVLAEAHDFKAQAGRIVLAPSTDGHIERVLFGLGDKPTPLLFGALAAHLPTGDYRLATTPREWPATLIAVAWALGGYGFARYKARPRQSPRLVAPEGADMTEAARIAAACYRVRDLVNTPANDLGPIAFEAAAREVAQGCGASFEAIVGDDLLAQNYPLIHAVGRAYAEPPRLLHLAWRSPDAPKEAAPRVALVGKGVTFDTGGLDIKPSASMRLMKKDMGGAAHALALGQLIMQSNLPIALDVFLPIAENSISSRAFRPSDIYKSRKGLTVEIDNTDAEGRLILADALARASEDNPDLIIDFATLTGAARTALGPDVAPLYTDDDTLAADFERAAKETFDPLWRMPLWDAYESDIDSQIADIKNTGDGAMAGSIAAALFLRRFVSAKAWAHLDIYAWAAKERPSRPAGGEAQCLRACWALLKKRYAKA